MRMVNFSRFIDKKASKLLLLGVFIAGIVFTINTFTYALTGQSIQSDATWLNMTEQGGQLIINDPFSLNGKSTDDSILAWYQRASLQKVAVSNMPLTLDPKNGVISGAEWNAKHLANTKAKFLYGIKHPSGLLINIYHSDPNNEQDIQIDTNGISTILSYVLENAASLNQGYLNTNEINWLKKAETNQALKGRLINLVIYANQTKKGKPLCLEDINLTLKNKTRKCDYQGYMESFNKSNHQTVSIMAIQSRPQDRSLPKQVIARNNHILLSQTLSHEFAHFLANASGARARHSNNFDLEHEKFVESVGEAAMINNHLNFDEYVVAGEIKLVSRPPFTVLPIQMTYTNSHR